MSFVGLIPDIPKIYTAFAEWISCIIYILLCNKHLIPNKKQIKIAGISLVALIGIQQLIGIVPVGLWIPGMITAFGIMFLMLWNCCDFTIMTAVYWSIRAFVLAEFSASFEWQLNYYIIETFHIKAVWFSTILLFIIYGIVFSVVLFLEKKHAEHQISVSQKELWTNIMLGISIFIMSNLSYVFTNTPFSSPLAREAFNIRTLIDLGGFAFLYAYHIQRCEDHMKSELDSIQNILHKQYAQYRQSRESIEIINHKYHDIKHQIAILRKERDPDKREEFLVEMERGITDYEVQFKTGNGVLDTILTGKALYCARFGITLTCVADGNLLNSMYVMDICTIFGNALDNAIECVLQINEVERRLIHVSVSEMNDFTLIRIENYMEEVPKFKNGFPMTTKGDTNYHGFGLKSIQYSAQKYNGAMTVDAEGNWFVLKVLIPQEN